MQRQVVVCGIDGNVKEVNELLYLDFVVKDIKFYQNCAYYVLEYGGEIFVGQEVKKAVLDELRIVKECIKFYNDIVKTEKCVNDLIVINGKKWDSYPTVCPY